MKLSIIIPYYNTKIYTDELLKQLDKQVNNDVEVILIDDGSIDPYKSDFKWLTIIRKENGGVSSARNVGLDKAKGDYIAFIDSDDLIDDEYITLILDKIEKEQFDYAYMSWKAFENWNTTIQLNNVNDEFPEWNLCCWNRIYKRDCIKNIRFNIKKLIAEDAEFIREVQKQCFKKAVITKPIYLYRGGRPNSLTQSYGQGKLDFKRIVYNYNHITADMKWLLEEVKKENEENEVIILTNRNEIPELKNYAMVMTPKYVNGDELRGEQTQYFNKIKKPVKKQVIVYTSVLQKIGGIETFIYNWLNALKDDYEILLLYKDIPILQLRRYMKLAKCERIDENKNYICDTLIMQRITDITPKNIEYGQMVQMLHAVKTKDYEAPKLGHKVVAPTNVVLESYGLKENVIQNITQPMPPFKVLKLVSATRLASDKGEIVKRIHSLANQLTNANIPFIWLVFTNSPQLLNNINGLIPMQPQVDISGYINEADYLVQLSDAEAFCYSIVEALELGTPVITTPISVLNELNIKDGENAIIVPFDMQGIDINKIYNSHFEFEYKIDNAKSIKQWHDILGVPKPFIKYDGGNNMYKLKVTTIFNDLQANTLRNVGDIFEADDERAMYLVEERELCEIVEKVETKKKPVEVAVAEVVEEEKAVPKKTTTRKKATK